MDDTAGSQDEAKPYSLRWAPLQFSSRCGERAALWMESRCSDSHDSNRADSRGPLLYHLTALVPLSTGLSSWLWFLATSPRHLNDGGPPCVRSLSRASHPSHRPHSSRRQLPPQRGSRGHALSEVLNCWISPPLRGSRRPRAQLSFVRWVLQSHSRMESHSGEGKSAHRLIIK